MSFNLLPHERSQFASKEYWDEFFKKRGDEAFEWYGEYPQLCGILHKYMKPTDAILNIGCGNSRLSAEIYDLGIENIVNVDISEVVVARMREVNKNRVNMKWEVGDATRLDAHIDESFGVVVDKGTLDALFADEEAATLEAVDRMLGEVSRLLKFGGRYICLTLAQDFIVNRLLSWFERDGGWIIRVHRVFDMDADEASHHMPLFAVVCTKFKKGGNCLTLVEISVSSTKLERVESVEVAKNAIASAQEFAVVRHRLSTKEHRGDEIPIYLYDEVNLTSPRYEIFVVDVDETKIAMKKSFAVFIVPDGRETEWLFNCKEGRSQLASSAGFSRLLVVLLNRNHVYGDMEQVKSDLSSKVLELAPPNKSNEEVPFLSIGDDIGKRTVLQTGESELSGPFVVEEVEVADGSILRRLIFLRNPNVIQSEVNVVTETVTKKKKKKTISKTKKVVSNSLSFEYSRFMMASLSFLPRFEELLKTKMETLILGLGGGCLTSFLHRRFPRMYLDAVEIDPAVVDVAIKHFGLQTDERLRTHVADGFQFLNDLAEEKRYHVIVLDCDNKDLSCGISCPPPELITPDWLDLVLSRLYEDGLFMVNLVCRDAKLRSELINKLQSFFGNRMWIKKVEDQVNEVLICYKSAEGDDRDYDDYDAERRKYLDSLPTEELKAFMMGP